MIFFEVLIVLHASPVAAPAEAVAGEELVSEVVVRDLIFKCSRAIGVGFARVGLYDYGAVLASAHAGILQGVEVDGQPAGVGREFLGTVDHTVAETRRVIGLHRPFVVGIEVVDESDAGDGVVLAVEFAEDVEEILRDALVADDLAPCGVAMKVSVEHPDEAKTASADAAAVWEGLALHAGKDRIADRVDAEGVAGLCVAGHRQQTEHDDQ